MKAMNQEGITGVITNPYFCHFEMSQNRDLWFTLPPQRSLIVSWLFSVIPIPLSIFYSSSLHTFY